VNPRAASGTSRDLPRVLPVLGSTGSDPRALALLSGAQRTRRLLVLRAVLDAVCGAPPGALPAGAADRMLRDWRLLAAADRADPPAAFGGGAAGAGVSGAEARGARRVVHYPLTGAWAERCLQALNRRDLSQAAAHLPHLAALSAAAAVRAGLHFTAEVPVRDGVLALPTLGSYRPPRPTARVTGLVDGDGGRFWLRTDEPARAVEVRRGPDGVWRSAAPGWHPIHALGTPAPRTGEEPDGSRPVLVDDADPYRDEARRTDPYGLSVARRLDAAEHARWRTAWRDAQPWLRLGDGSRAREVAALLDCFVPLADTRGEQYSATLGDSFGALLSSTPRDGLMLAAALVHELQHTKLLSLSRLTVLHTADDTPRHWAPWRPDPRPFDGVFQGAYAHLALADFHLSVARATTDPAQREAAWAAHCRRRQQVEAVLPQLLGSRSLTGHGRTLVSAMAAHHTRLKGAAPPEGHLARAAAYVEVSRMMWRRGRARPDQNGH
jgi:HEXXH motif-containing protein